MNLNDPDNLYTSDPFMFNILSPQSCYIDFPSWPNPNRPKPNNPIPEIPRPNLYEKINNAGRHFEYDSPSVFDFKALKDRNFSQTKDSLKFRLEMAGFAKEDVSVSVKIEDYTLKVESINKQKPFSRNFVIPNAGNYNLLSGAAQMSNGLLEIFFAPKKEEVKTIKIL